MVHNNYNGALQHSLGSGFDAQSTAANVMAGINLTGKLAIVTGGNTGIGLETTKALAAAGATVVVAVRDVGKALRNLGGIDHVEVEHLDISQPSAIDAFAAKFCASGRALHLLINNAGIMWVPLRRDSRGIESQLATNYLGQFHLTARLWPALKLSGAARVVNVSSLGHHMAPFNFEDPNFEQRAYETLQAYGQSKTACNLFTVQLDDFAKRSHVRAYAVHPGSIAGTELGREASVEMFQKMGFVDELGQMRPEVLAKLKTVSQGAATTLWAASSPLLDRIGGVYCEDCDIATLIADNPAVPTTAKVHQNGVRQYSLDQRHAQRLWTLTEQMIGLRFKAQ